MESLYITKSGKLARRQNTIWLQTKNGERYFYPVKNVEDIHVFSKIELNSSFLEFMSKEKLWFISTITLGIIQGLIIRKNT